MGAKCDDTWEERLKTQNQVIDVVNKLNERWKQRITRHNLRLTDRFVDFDLHVLLHFTVKDFDSAEMWVACFEVVRRVANLTEPIGDQETIMGVCEESSVLVDVVQLVESPQNISLPAFVWFERINNFYDFGEDTLYFSSLVPFVSSGVLRNRELNLPAGLLPGPDPSQLVCKVVECASEVVNDIASQPQRVKGQDSVLSELARLRFRISRNSVELLHPERSKFGLQITEMCLGPVNFYAHQDKSVCRRKSHQNNRVLCSCIDFEEPK